MLRPTTDLTALDGIEDTTFIQSGRLVLPNPRHGGPSLLEIRKALKGKGRVRITATTARVFVDIDPGEEEPPLIALETIARDDAAGLERMILSVLPIVDEIVIGIDGRSKPETLKIAQAYADEVHVFEAADIGVSLEDWNLNRIDFSRARNIGRSRVLSKWTLVIDTDEYLVVGKDDIRERVKKAPDALGSLAPRVILGGNTFEDAKRLARTEYRWERAQHNVLMIDKAMDTIDFKIVSDLSLRTLDEQSRRHEQRDRGIEEMVEAAAAGDLGSLFHLAKHRTYGKPEDFQAAVKMVEDYRLRIEPHSPLADERAWLALGIAFRYYQDDDLLEADRWCCRALLDGPSCAAFCLLGDIAEDQGDLQRAHDWYQAACVIEDRSKLKWPGVTEMRYNRLGGIKLAMLDPSNVVELDAEMLSPSIAAT